MRWLCPRAHPTSPKEQNGVLRKKHDNPAHTAASDLPLGVRYNPDTHMYYGEITPFGYDGPAKLEEWNTPEEAFEEYRIIKKADITVTAVKYKNYIL